MSLGAARPSKKARESGLCTHSAHVRRARLVRSVSFVTSDIVRLPLKATFGWKIEQRSPRPLEPLEVSLGAARPSQKGTRARHVHSQPPREACEAREVRFVRN